VAQDIGIQTYHIDGKNSIAKLFSNN
jgi:hypothetical protein